MSNRCRRPALGFSSYAFSRRTILLPSLLLLSLPMMLAFQPGKAQPTVIPSTTPTFYRDVLPILQQHCQRCHREGEIGPMPLVSYQQSRHWAGEIRQKVRMKQMPPWFADPAYGRFSDDPSLSEQEITMLSSWADAHAPADNP